MQRRTLISGLAALVPAFGVRRLFGAEEAPARSCQLITQDARGPYDIEDYLLRSDIREGQPGMPLTLDFQVMNVMGCTPLASAMVSIWHANAEGLYSGVENVVLDANLRLAEGGKVDKRSEAFCRGVQKTDAEGRVRFVTNFPGWYYPRAPHIHLKVVPPDYGEEAVTQLYFLPAVCEEIYATEHYAERGINPIKTEPGQADPMFSTEADDLWLELHRHGDGYIARHELGVVFYGGMFGELPETYRQS